MKYHWLPTGCSPSNYPVKIFNSAFVLGNGVKIDIPSNSIINNGWGQIGSIRLVGEDLNPLPKKLEITWFSFIEDKFYSGEFDLPEDKLTEYFKNGFIDANTGTHDNFEYLVVGTSPGGGVSMWVRGGILSKEVTQYWAKEVNYDWGIFTDASPLPRTQFVKYGLNDVMSDKEVEISKNTMNPLKWMNIYRKEYLWDLQIISTLESEKTLTYYFNGTSEFILKSKNPPSNRTIPLSFNIEWVDKKKKNVEIQFDEDEILKAFDVLNNGDTLTFQPEINSLTYEIEVYIKNSKNVVQLKKCKFETG